MGTSPPSDINGFAVLVGRMVAIATLSYKSAHLRVGEVTEVTATGFCKVRVTSTGRTVTKRCSNVAIVSG